MDGCMDEWRDRCMDAWMNSFSASACGESLEVALMDALILGSMKV